MSPSTTPHSDERSVGGLTNSGRGWSLSRNSVVLLFAAAALLVFIAVLGDWRRVNNALAQAATHAEFFQTRVGEGGLLPLNLEPDIPPEQRDKYFRMEWLSSDEALRLRSTREPVLAAQSVALPRLVGEDGRAVILFHEGRFRATWMRESEYRGVSSAQRERLKSVGAVTP